MDLYITDMHSIYSYKCDTINAYLWCTHFEEILLKDIITMLKSLDVLDFLNYAEYNGSFHLVDALLFGP